MCKYEILEIFYEKNKMVHYKIKVLIISRFNYYEIMLIECLLIIYDAYRVNKLIEAKLGLGHLSEHGKKHLKIMQSRKQLGALL
jgi:hypothetical protein